MHAYCVVSQLEHSHGHIMVDFGAAFRCCQWLRLTEKKNQKSVLLFLLLLLLGSPLRMSHSAIWFEQLNAVWYTCADVLAYRKSSLACLLVRQLCNTHTVFHPAAWLYVFFFWIHARTLIKNAYLRRIKRVVFDLISRTTIDGFVMSAFYTSHFTLKFKAHSTLLPPHPLHAININF